MSKSLQSAMFGIALVAAQLALPASQAKAGPFLDWLFGRPIYTYPAPTVANYAPTTVVPATVGAPLTAGYSGCATGNCAAPSGCCTPTAPAAVPYTPVVTGYAPTVAARASYPVTSYYPGVAAAPYAAPYSPQDYIFQPYYGRYVPSYRTTWMQVPVTNYRPVTAYQGVAAQPVMQPCNTCTWQAQRVPSLFHRPWLPAAPAQPGAVQYAPAYGQPMVTQPVVAQPYGSVPPNMAPGCANCGGTPAINSAPMTVPSTPSAPSAPTTVPADQAPTLSPNSFQGGAAAPNSAMRSVPSTSPASSNRVAPSSVYQVTPIPVPELRDRQPSDSQPAAPPLLNARDRTASAQAAPRNSTVTAAVWAAPAAKPASAPALTPKVWDDSGWQTSKSW